MTEIVCATPAAATDALDSVLRRTAIFHRLAATERQHLAAIAVYQSRPHPASAVALEPATCLLIPRQAFFSLLEHSPSMVRGLLAGLTHSLGELTNRVTEPSTGASGAPRAV